MDSFDNFELGQKSLNIPGYLTILKGYKSCPTKSRGSLLVVPYSVGQCLLGIW